MVKQALQQVGKRAGSVARSGATPDGNLFARGQFSSAQTPEPSSARNPTTPSDLGASDVSAKETAADLQVADARAAAVASPRPPEREKGRPLAGGRLRPEEGPPQPGGRREERPPGSRGSSRRRPSLHLGRMFDDLTAFVVPREKGDTRDIVLVCLSFGILVYISQNLVRAYLSMLHVMRHM